jgi:site-specific recombinase XerD
MSYTELRFLPFILRLRDHFHQQSYSFGVTQNYPVAVRRFLRNLERRGRRVESISPAEVESYLDTLRIRRGRGAFPAHSRRMHRAAIHMLLRLVRSEWPPAPTPTDARELSEQHIVGAYDDWMKELRGLSMGTRRRARAETHRLLRWIGSRKKSVASLSVEDLDTYIASRSVTMRRPSIALLVSDVRGIVRHLHRTDQVPVDLAKALRGPPLYALEGIPSTIEPEAVQRALAALKKDRTALGRRDYAIWMLFVTYGLRSGEVRKLRLSDIDWRHERLRIRHSKTGAHSDLPLLREVANALLSYLRHGRPATAERTVFLRGQAPYKGLSDSSSVYGVISRRLSDVGVVLPGKRGPHVLRHTRAVSLLRGGATLKVIGDVLGHRSERSTAPYLKLATEDLRSVALAIPSGVSP